MILKETIVWENVNTRKTKMPTYIENYCKSYNVLVTDVVYEENRVTFTAYTKLKYDDIVVRLIREKYSQNEEFSLINKGIVNSLDEEYVAYRDFVSNCKYVAQEFVKEREVVFAEKEQD